MPTSDQKRAADLKHALNLITPLMDGGSVKAATIMALECSNQINDLVDTLSESSKLVAGNTRGAIEMSKEDQLKLVRTMHDSLRTKMDEWLKRFGENMTEAVEKGWK